MRGQLSDFFGFVMFFLTIIFLIFLISFSNFFSFKSESLSQKVPYYDNSFYTTFDSFLEQPIFPSSLLKPGEKGNVSFLDILSYEFSNNDYEFLSSAYKDPLFVHFSPLYNFKISFVDNNGHKRSVSFIFSDLPSNVLKNKECVPVSSSLKEFYFPFEVSYYDDRGNLKFKKVVISNIVSSSGSNVGSSGVCPNGCKLCILKEKNK